MVKTALNVGPKPVTLSVTQLSGRRKAWMGRVCQILSWEKQQLLLISSHQLTSLNVEIGRDVPCQLGYTSGPNLILNVCHLTGKKGHASEYQRKGILSHRQQTQQHTLFDLSVSQHLCTSVFSHMESEDPALRPLGSMQIIAVGKARLGNQKNLG